MTDRELLELAAKAVGIKLYVWNDFNGVEHYASLDAKPYGAIWNPLKDDGAALRLAVKLGLLIDLMSIEGSAVTKPCVSVEDSEGLWEVQLCDSDPYAATRRAIASAAAEIGKEKP